VLDRIPPRLKVREKASVELPHIMLLIDDRKDAVIKPFYDKRESLEKLYDFDLNMKGGHLTGYRLDAKEVLSVFDKFESSVEGLYGKKTDFIFAVGDGNHSLATAQAHWNNIKGGLSAEERENHPARYALVEIENLHDNGITFEPIHRYVFTDKPEEFVMFMTDAMKGSGKLKMFTNSMEYTVSSNPNNTEAIAEVQAAVDAYLKQFGGRVDYIHGMEHLRSIADAEKGVAIVMPTLAKDELFRYVVDHGNLCRKAFSMGEAEEKRYYFEAKKIVK
jgi:hypothetical protein